MTHADGLRSAVSLDRRAELDPQVADLIELAASELTAPEDPTPDDRRALAAVVSPLFRGPVDMAELVPVGITKRTVLSSDGAAVDVHTYAPANPASSVAVLYIHGGGFVAGSTETYDPELRRLVTRTGMTVSSVDYRLSPEHQRPAAIEDCLAAAHALIESGEADALALAGDSAGGQLVLECAVRLAREGVALAALLLVYPVVDPSAQGNESYRVNGQDYMLVADDMAYYWKSYLGADGDQSEPVFPGDDLRGLPPTVVVTAGFDPLRDEGRQLVTDLVAADVQVTYVPNPTLTHGFQQMVPRVEAATLAVDAAYRTFRNVAEAATTQ